MAKSENRTEKTNTDPIKLGDEQNSTSPTSENNGQKNPSKNHSIIQAILPENNVPVFYSAMTSGTWANYNHGGVDGDFMTLEKRFNFQRDLARDPDVYLGAGVDGGVFMYDSRREFFDLKNLPPSVAASLLSGSITPVSGFNGLEPYAFYGKENFQIKYKPLSAVTEVSFNDENKSLHFSLDAANPDKGGGYSVASVGMGVSVELQKQGRQLGRFGVEMKIENPESSKGSQISIGGNINLAELKRAQKTKPPISFY